MYVKRLLKQSTARRSSHFHRMPEEPIRKKYRHSTGNATHHGSRVSNLTKSSSNFKTKNMSKNIKNKQHRMSIPSVSTNVSKGVSDATIYQKQAKENQPHEKLHQKHNAEPNVHRNSSKSKLMNSV